jgi:hypothetical protein
MARTVFAPTHDVCAAARFVPEGDDAWNLELVEKECDEIREAVGWTPASKDPDPAKDRTHGHIYYRYHCGVTRFDLDADGISNYLSFEKKPEIWRLRRLPLAVRAELRLLVRRGEHDRSMYLAFTAGCAGLDNPANEQGQALATELAKAKRHPDKILELAENYSTSSIVHVAYAVQELAADLSDQEKKASASPAGEPS